MLWLHYKVFFQLNQGCQKKRIRQILFTFLSAILLYSLHQYSIRTIVKGETILGASLITSAAFPFLGKAMTSRILSSPANNIAKRSNPNAIPPCGGNP